MRCSECEEEYGEYIEVRIGKHEIAGALALLSEECLHNLEEDEPDHLGVILEEVHEMHRMS